MKGIRWFFKAWYNDIMNSRPAGRYDYAWLIGAAFVLFPAIMLWEFAGGWGFTFSSPLNAVGVCVFVIGLCLISLPHAGLQKRLDADWKKQKQKI